MDGALDGSFRHLAKKCQISRGIGGWGEIRTHGGLTPSTVFKTVAYNHCGSGQGGIRTHGTLARSPVFKTGAINRSATCPLGFISFYHHFAQPKRRDCSPPGRWRTPLGASADLLTLCMRKHAADAGHANEAGARVPIDHSFDHRFLALAHDKCSYSVHDTPTWLVFRHARRPNPVGAGVVALSCPHGCKWTVPW